MEERRSDFNIQIFKGASYKDWKHRITYYLRSLGLREFIEGETPESPTEAWRKKNEKAVMMVMKHLDDKLLDFTKPGYIGEYVTAKNVFKKLDDVYGVTNVAAQSAIFSKIMDLKMAAGTKMEEHFLTFQGLVNDYEATGASLDEAQKILFLSRSVPKDYAIVVHNMKNAPRENYTVATLKNRLLEHEQEITQASRDTSQKVLLTNQEVAEKDSNNFKNEKYRRGQGNRRNFRGSYKNYNNY